MDVEGRGTFHAPLLRPLSGAITLVLKPSLTCHPDCRAAHAAVTAAGQVIQVGVLTMATWTIELLLERGVLYAAGSILAQIVQGATPTIMHPGFSWAPRP